MKSENAPRFFVDAMLGDVARWLRILGFDTAYDTRASTHDGIDRANREERIFLTRNRRVREWSAGGKYILLPRGSREEHLRILAAGLPILSASRVFSRCISCNVPVEKAAPDAAAPHVPSLVLEHTRIFYHCPSCGRYFWYGSHIKNVEKTVERWKAAWGVPGTGE